MKIAGIFLILATFSIGALTEASALPLCKDLFNKHQNTSPLMMSHWDQSIHLQLLSSPDQEWNAWPSKPVLAPASGIYSNTLWHYYEGYGNPAISSYQKTFGFYNGDTLSEIKSKYLIEKKVFLDEMNRGFAEGVYGASRFLTVSDEIYRNYQSSVTNDHIVFPFTIEHFALNFLYQLHIDIAKNAVAAIELIDFKSFDFRTFLNEALFTFSRYLEPNEAREVAYANSYKTSVYTSKAVQRYLEISLMRPTEQLRNNEFSAAEIKAISQYAQQREIVKNSFLNKEIRAKFAVYFDQVKELTAQHLSSVTSP